MSIFSKLAKALGRRVATGEKLDVSETVSEVVGGGLAGVVVGETVEEVAKAVTKPKKPTDRKVKK